MTADRGRGIFATKDLSKGELVIVEKALVEAFEEEAIEENS